MEYTLAGQFLEACDCTVICPCWVDDDPVGGHCTGFIAWQIDEGDTAVVNGIPVGGCTVVSVATHGGNRRDTNKTTTMLYIDVPAEQRASADADEQHRALADLFSGRFGGPLSDLAQVNGTVVGDRRASISISPPNEKHWTVTVRPADDRSGTVFVQANGSPKVFDAQRGNKEPLTLEHTAISYELSAAGSVEAQDGERLVVNVGALPGGNLEVTGRSGMRGAFHYDHSADQPVASGAADTGTAKGR